MCRCKVFSRGPVHCRLARLSWGGIPSSSLQRPVTITTTMSAICSLAAGHQAGAPVPAAICLAAGSLRWASGCASNAFFYDAAQPGEPTGVSPVSCRPGSVAGACGRQVCPWQAKLQLPALVCTGLRHFSFTCCCTCAIALKSAVAAFVAWLPCVTASAGTQWCITTCFDTLSMETWSLSHTAQSGLLTIHTGTSLSCLASHAQAFCTCQCI